MKKTFLFCLFVTVACGLFPMEKFTEGVDKLFYGDGPFFDDSFSPNSPIKSPLGEKDIVFGDENLVISNDGLPDDFDFGDDNFPFMKALPTKTPQFQTSPLPSQKPFDEDIFDLYLPGNDDSFEGGFGCFEKSDPAELIREAIQRNDIRDFIRLADCGARLDKRDENGQSLLHLAMYGGCPVIVELLIERYGVPLDVVDDYGNTPLHIAYAQKKYSYAIMLERRGANGKVKNRVEKTPKDLGGRIFWELVINRLADMSLFEKYCEDGQRSYFYTKRS